MYGAHAGVQGAGTLKRRKAQRDEPTSTPTLPPHLRDQFGEEYDLYYALQEANHEVDSHLARGMHMWHAFFMRKNEGGLGVKPRVLRLCVYNTHEHQGAHYSLGEAAGESRWTLRIEGRLLPDPGVPENNDATEGVKFSHFIKHISVELDQELYKNDWFIEWDSRRHVGVTDGFELTREGDRETTVKILIEVAYPIQLYTLSPPLASLVKSQLQTHDAVLRSIYSYAVDKKLLRTTSSIECDGALKAIVGEEFETVEFDTLPGHIRRHLTPAPPLEIEHRVQVSGTPEQNMHCWDVTVQDVTQYLQKSSSRSEDVTELEKEIAALVDQIGVASKKQKAFTAMAKDPAQFVNLLMRSEVRDAALLEAHEDSEAHRNASFYMHPYIADAVGQYLLRQKTLQSRDQ